MITDILGFNFSGFFRYAINFAIIMAIVLVFCFILNFVDNENSKQSSLANKDHFLITTSKVKMLCYILTSVVFFIMSIFFLLTTPISLEELSDFAKFVIVPFVAIVYAYRFIHSIFWSLDISDVMVLKRFFREDKTLYFKDIISARATEDNLKVYFSDGFVLKIKLDYNCCVLFANRLDDENISIVVEFLPTEDCYCILYFKKNTLEFSLGIIYAFGVAIMTILINGFFIEQFLKIIFFLLVSEILLIRFYVKKNFFKIYVNHNTIILRIFLRKDLYFDFESIEHVKIKKTGFIKTKSHYNLLLKDGFKFSFNTDFCCCDLFENSLKNKNVSKS